MTRQWAARVRHLLLFVATAWTLFQSTPRSTKSSLNVDRHVFVGRPLRLPLPRGVMTWLNWLVRWHPDNTACHPKLSLCYNVL